VWNSGNKSALQDELDTRDLLAAQNAESAIEASEVGTFEQLAPAGGSVFGALDITGLGQDAKFILSSSVWVLSMDARECLQSLFIPVLASEPSWRLGYEV
jgi:hypothetical protein